MPQPPAILIAENQPDVLALMAEVLRRAECAVTVARGGAEALVVAERTRWAVDLLVADVRMPWMTGPELAASLRRHVPGLRVLYVSAGFADAAVAEEVARGEAQFLQKPFTPAELMATLKGILGDDRCGRPVDA